MMLIVTEHYLLKTHLEAMLLSCDSLHAHSMTIPYSNSVAMLALIQGLCGVKLVLLLGYT